MRGKIPVSTVIIKRVLDQELPFKYKVDGGQTQKVAPNNIDIYE